MEKFAFKAIRKSGETYEGIRESTDKFSLYAELKAEGSTLVSASLVGEKKHWSGFVSDLLSAVPELQKIIFTKNLGYMIDAGLSVAKSLAVLEKQIKNKKFKTIIAALSLEIRKGQTLSQAASAYPNVFSNLFVSMVRAGEESGKLAESLQIVGEQMDGMYKLKKKIRGAMIYPSVILFVMATVGILMLVFVVPSITATFNDLHVELPFMTRVLISSSNFLKDNIILSLLLLIALVIAGYFFSLSKSGRRLFDFVSIHAPVVGDLVKEANSARITRTVSSLLSSGVPFAKAVSITGDVIQNSYFRAILSEASLKVEKGETISSVFLAKSDLCPVFVGEMMAVGEETGRMPSMLMEVAKFYENSVDQKTKDMSTIIEPVLMVIIGVAVGFFALAMIKPIYSVMDTLN